MTPSVLKTLFVNDTHAQRIKDLANKILAPGGLVPELIKAADEVQHTMDDLRDALKMLERTGRGLESALSQDFSMLHPEEQAAIISNSRKIHANALKTAQDVLRSVSIGTGTYAKAHYHQNEAIA